MPEYRRAFFPGATFFFTVVTNFRRPILTAPGAIECLRAAFRRAREHHSLEIDAIVVLPDHVHTIWTLPAGDVRFSMRWSAIKGEFTRLFLAAGGSEAGRSASRRRRGERSVWQRRFWEHLIRDEYDYNRHMDYIHYNPVRHGHASCPHAWAYGSFPSGCAPAPTRRTRCAFAGDAWRVRPILATSSGPPVSRVRPRRA